MCFWEEKKRQDRVSVVRCDGTGGTQGLEPRQGARSQEGKRWWWEGRSMVGVERTAVRTAASFKYLEGLSTMSARVVGVVAQDDVW